MNNCVVCNFPTSFLLEAEEKMYGLDKKFNYNICNNCGLVQIQKIPDDLPSYYKTYYGRSGLKTQSLSFYLRYLRFKSQFYKKRGLGSVIGYFLEDSLGSTYGKLRIDKHLKILDIGSADGFLPYMLHDVGYKNVVGIDPYIDSSIEYENQARVEKKLVEEIAEKSYDVVTLNHVLEHLSDQHATLSCVRKILNDDGVLIVRIPTVSSDAFNIYRENWYQLDAPRHLYLHSHKSIKELLNLNGFTVQDIICDSTIWQYFSSMLYTKGTPFYKHLAKFIYALPLNIITCKLFQYKKATYSANKTLRGDQIVVVAKLKK